jgi:hypothetical protein
MRVTFKTPRGRRRQTGRYGKPLEAEQLAWHDGELVITTERISDRARMPMRVTFTPEDIPVLLAALRRRPQGEPQ